MAARRPNLLLITTDQQRYDHLGLKGVGGIDTPNLDRLGRDGVHFDRAYTSCPVCTPARVTLLTGQYPSVHGAYSIGVTVDPFPRPTLADRLAGAGYATAIFGKTHFVRRQDEPAHVAGFPDPPPAFFHTFTGPYLGFQEVRVSRGHTTNGVPDMHYRAFLEAAGVDYADWFPDVNGRHDHDAVGAWDISPDYHDTSWVSGNTIDWIERRAAQAPDQPWFCWASFQDPHEPFLCPRPWYDLVRAEEMQLYPDYREGEFDDKPAFYQEAYDAGFSTQTLGERDPASQSTWSSFNDGHGIPSAFHRQPLTDHAAEALRATLGMVAFIDDRVGAMMAALAATGQAENTVVVFTTDHGEIHGHHGLWHKGLFAYESCQRIPMLAWGPAHVAPLGTLPALVNLVDLPGTLLSLAGVEIPIGMQGKDLTPVLRGDAPSVRDWTMVEFQATQNVYQQTFITERYKLVVYRDLAAGELYDLAEDPEQAHNLWDRSEHLALRTHLLQRMIQATMEKEGRVHPRRAFA